jgi:hypothetical protein
VGGGPVYYGILKYQNPFENWIFAVCGAVTFGDPEFFPARAGRRYGEFFVGRIFFSGQSGRHVFKRTHDSGNPCIVGSLSLVEGSGGVV